MSTTRRSKPYSDIAMSRAARAMAEGYGEVFEPWHVQHTPLVLDAAHDREVLGRDASARIGDILDDVVGRLRAQQQATASVVGLDTAASLIEHWYGHDR